MLAPRESMLHRPSVTGTQRAECQRSGLRGVKLLLLLYCIPLCVMRMNEDRRRRL